MSNFNFSDEPLVPDILDHYENYAPAQEFAPAVPAGVYQFYLAQIRDAAEFDTDDGKRLSTTLDLRVVGGEHDDRAVMFQRLSNGLFERPRGSGHLVSQLMDLGKAAKQAPALSNQQAIEMLEHLVEAGAGESFPAQIDWRGFCNSCYTKKICEITKEKSAVEAKKAATSEQRIEAANFATKAKSHRAFPINNDGKREDNFICPDCDDEIRAQVRIQRFIIPEEE